MPDSRPALPDAELIDQGCIDLRAGRTTIAACLVAIAAGRLRAAGADVPADPAIADPEHRLYALCCAEVGGDGDAGFARYNALLRSLTSHCSARERRAAYDASR